MAFTTNRSSRLRVTHWILRCLRGLETMKIQLDLFLDYASNVALYPKFQAFFRENRPPLLAVWGQNDPFFLPAGAKAFARDNPKAKVHFFDTGHFALETHATEIANTVKEFLGGVSF